jgi:predicted negative regulator of RcsB-dependent stress response
MAKDRSETHWTATHRYDDVYRCDNGQGIALSHSIAGLKVAKKNLESNGSDFAIEQLKHVDAKLAAIANAPDGVVLAPVDVAEEAGTE